MLRVIKLVVGGMATITVVAVCLMLGTMVVGPFYAEMGNAGAPLGTTANEAVDVGNGLFFLGSALIVVPVGIYLYLNTGGGGGGGGGRRPQRRRY